KVEIKDGKIKVEFQGLEELAAIKRKLEFDLNNVVSVSTDQKKWIEGLRVGGTGLPGIIKEGRYVMRGGKTAFFAMKDPTKCVTIEFKNEPYDYLIIEVEDKEKVAEMIKEAKRN
ncbi:MAG: hypothetical protein ACP5TK_00425, partial [Candidatus Micrarchaeia archaeon]